MEVWGSRPWSSGTVLGLYLCSCHSGIVNIANGLMSYHLALTLDLEGRPGLSNMIRMAESWPVEILHWSDSLLDIADDVCNRTGAQNAVRLLVFRLVPDFQFPHAKFA